MKNMRKLVCLFSLLSLWMAASVSAQSLKKQEATMEDYLPLLQAAAYQIYSFDVSEFLDDTYHFSFKIKEYVNREEVQRDGHSSAFSNRMMIAEFPEESQKSILEEGSAVDPEKGIYSQTKKLTIGFVPSKVDSTRIVRISLDGMGEIRTPLKLKPLKASKDDSKRTSKNNEIRNDLFCKYCGKQCKSLNSLRNHERLCNENQNRQILKSNFIAWNEYRRGKYL